MLAEGIFRGFYSVFKIMLKVKKEHIGTTVATPSDKSIVLANDTPQKDLEWVWGLGDKYKELFETPTKAEKNEVKPKNADN